MKKIAVLFSLCALFAALLLSCRQDTDLPPDITPPVTSDTDETTPPRNPATRHIRHGRNHPRRDPAVRGGDDS